MIFFLVVVVFAFIFFAFLFAIQFIYVCCSEIFAMSNKTLNLSQFTTVIYICSNVMTFELHINDKITIIYCSFEKWKAFQMRIIFY